MFIAGHNKLHTFCFAYLLNQQTFGQFGRYLGRGKDPSPIATSAFHSSSLSNSACPLTTAVSSVGSGSNFFHLLASGCCCWTICTSIAVQLPEDFRGGNRRQWLCLGYCTEQREDQKVPSQRGFSFLFPSLSIFSPESVDSQLLFPFPPPLLCSRDKRRWKRSGRPQAL